MASVDKAKENLLRHCNQHNMPLTLVALKNGKAVGMASLRENDGIRPDISSPWLGSLVVGHSCRQQKIGKRLIDAIKQVLNFGLNNLYLFAFEPTIPNGYAKLD